MPVRRLFHRRRREPIAHSLSVVRKPVLSAPNDLLDRFDDERLGIREGLHAGDPDQCSEQALRAALLRSSRYLNQIDRRRRDDNTIPPQVLPESAPPPSADTTSAMLLMLRLSRMLSVGRSLVVPGFTTLGRSG